MRLTTISRLVFAAFAAIWITALHDSALAQDTASKKVLLIVIDGLRPDYVTPKVMPNLLGLGNRGVVGLRHRAVFPTVTRVNASSLVTGCYPQKHGLLGNAVYFPEVDAAKGLSTGDAANLEKIAQATGGKLLLVPSLGEILKAAGKKTMVFSSGSSGSAFLLDHTLSGAGTIHVDGIRPESLAARFAHALGPVPPDATPNTERNRYIVDAYVKAGLGDEKPDLAIMWITDPDHTAHKFGPGAPQTVESLRAVDAELGRILTELNWRKQLAATNIIVTSDHGFSMHAGDPHPARTANIAGLLIQKGLKASPDSTDVIVVEGAIYVKDHHPEKIAGIVRELQSAPWAGAIFTRGATPESLQGMAPGTLSFASANWDSPRSADILVSANWAPVPNKYGFKGLTMLPGIAGHGTSSPFDIHNTLIAVGPDFKNGVKSNVTTGNVDIAPTICHLLGLPVPESMDGRVLDELLVNGPDPAKIAVNKSIDVAETALDGSGYRLELHAAIVGTSRYIEQTIVKRTRASTIEQRKREKHEED